jgi:hypothetical protein
MAEDGILSWTEKLHEKFANGIAVLLDMKRVDFKTERGTGLTPVKKQIAAALNVTPQTLHNYTVYRKVAGTLIAPLKLSIVLGICKYTNVEFTSFVYAIEKSRDSQEMMSMLIALRTGRAVLKFVEVEASPDNILQLPTNGRLGGPNSDQDLTDEEPLGAAPPRINFVGM